LDKSYLSRGTESKIYRDEYQDIIENLIYSPNSSNQLIKYSLNLFGHFESIDSAYKSSSKDHYSNWKEGTKGIYPDREFITFNDQAGNLFFKYSDIKILSLRYEDRSDTKNVINRKISSEIIHSPTKINFWHMEVLWKSDQTTYVSALSKSPQRAALSAIKTYLKTIADEYEPSQFYILEEKYFVAN